MAKLTYKSRIGVVLEAADGEEITAEQAAVYASLQIAEALDTLQLRIEQLTDTYNHYQAQHLPPAVDN